MANANGAFGLKPISKLGGNVNSTFIDWVY